MPLTPRELEVLDVVGEVMQERLLEVRKEYEGKLTELQTKVAALEARPMALRAFPDDIRLELAPLTAKVAEIDERCAMLPLPITEEINTLRQTLTDKIAVLESRSPEVTVEKLRAMGDDLEEVIERRLAMIPPPPDLTPINVKIAAWDEQPSPATVLQMAQKAVAEGQADVIERLESKLDGVVLETAKRFEALPPPVDLAPLAERVDDVRNHINEVAQVVAANVAVDALAANVDQRFKALPPLPDLTPLEEKIAALEAEAQILRREQPNLAPLVEKIAELEARPEPDLTSLADMPTVIDLLNARIAELPPPPDLTPLAEKVAALEARPEPDLAPLAEKVAALKSELEVDHTNLGNLHERVMAMEAKPSVDLTPLTEEVAALDAKTQEIRQEMTDLTEHQLVTLMDQRFAMLPPPRDLAPLEDKIAELDLTRPTNEEVLKLAEGALHSTRASLQETLQIAVVDLFKALPIPEKGDKGEPGINGTSVTVEQFRDLFEASYARFELETERRIMDLVQRTLDRVPLPKNGKDGVGLDDLNIVRDGRKVRHEYLRDGEVVKVFEYKSDDLQYREVYRSGEHYDRGDVVSWGGSIWIALADTVAAPNGKNGDWKLAVKEGRRGRSAYEIAVDKGFVGNEIEWLASLKGPPGKDAKPIRDQPDGAMRGSTEP
jgi:hypothetical protein